MRRSPKVRALKVRALHAASLAAVCLAAGCGEDAPASREPVIEGRYAGHNVLVISLDTCRRDALSLYGAPDDSSAHLASFARDAVVFEHARAPAPHTAPSHMSLFTSLLPSVHGVQNVQHGVHPETGKRRPLIESVPQDVPTLAEVLSARGYRCIGLTDGGNLNPPHGFDRGFEHYTADLIGAEAQFADAARWIGELRAGDAPWFLFVHTYEMHAPYVSPPEYVARWAPDDYEGPLRQAVDALQGKSFREAFGAMRSVFWKDVDGFGADEVRYLRGLYAAGVQYTDDMAASFLDLLRGSETFDDTLVVVLSDHGEEFAEHGRWQHEQLYEECLRVPLIVRLPGGAGGGTRIPTPVSLMDVMPTLLELLGVERDGLPGKRFLPMQGRSLARALVTGQAPEARPVFSELRSDRTFPDGARGPLREWKVAVVHQSQKIIVDEYARQAGRDDVRAFDLSADPDELQPDVLVDDAVRGALLEFHARFHRELELASRLEGVDAASELDCDQLRQLVELGYVDASALGDCD